MDAAEVKVAMSTDCTSLRFAETVEENFSFLQGHGFKRVQSEPAFVRFESSCIHLNVYHGRQSFEVGLEISPVGADSDDFVVLYVGHDPPR